MDEVAGKFFSSSFMKSVAAARWLSRRAIAVGSSAWARPDAPMRQAAAAGSATWAAKTFLRSPCPWAERGFEKLSQPQCARSSGPLLTRLRFVTSRGAGDDARWEEGWKIAALILLNTWTPNEDRVIGRPASGPARPTLGVDVIIDISSQLLRVP